MYYIQEHEKLDEAAKVDQKAVKDNQMKLKYTYKKGEEKRSYFAPHLMTWVSHMTIIKEGVSRMRVSTSCIVKPSSQGLEHYFSPVVRQGKIECSMEHRETIV